MVRSVQGSSSERSPQGEEITVNNQEKVIYQAKPHWFFLTRFITIVFIGLFIVFVGIIMTGSSGFDGQTTTGTGLAFCGTCSFCSGGIITAIGILMTLIGFLKYRNASYIVTNQRIIIKGGISTKYNDETMIHQIETIRVRSDSTGRLLGFGDLEFIGSGGSKTTLVMVTNPHQIQKHISNILSQKRQQYRY